MREFWTTNGLFQNSMQGKQSDGALSHGLKRKHGMLLQSPIVHHSARAFSVAPPAYNVRAISSRHRALVDGSIYHRVREDLSKKAGKHLGHSFGSTKMRMHVRPLALCPKVMVST